MKVVTMLLSLLFVALSAALLVEAWVPSITISSNHPHSQAAYSYDSRITISSSSRNPPCRRTGAMMILHQTVESSSPDLSSSSSPSNPGATATADDELLSHLKKFGYDQRLQVLSTKDLPVLAEVFLSGRSQLCEILAFRPTKEPTVQVKILPSFIVESNNNDNNNGEDDDDDDNIGEAESNTVVVVDIGQITTAWKENQHNANPSTKNANDHRFLEQVPDQLNRLPVGSVEATMDGLYQTHVGGDRSPTSSSSSSNTKALTKKQITKLCSTISNDIDRQHAEHVMRQVLKVGTGCSRVVDSTTAAASLYSFSDQQPFVPASKAASSNNSKDSRQPTERARTEQAVAAYLLSQDSKSGGRFKRFPSIFVNKVMSSDGEVISLSIINGGWLVVDQSVRAGSEARKFAVRVQSSNSEDSEQQATTGWTVSDERITQRLECLAMGEVLSQSESKNSDTVEHSLELDVRETLKALSAPTTPEGAQDVLIRVGRWSKGQTSGAAQPWSPKVLEAASWYADNCEAAKANKKAALQNGRSDLTNVPFVCIDSKRTSFRDDAIGLRPRSVTGRAVSDASKWEILISIADTSNVYVDATAGEATSVDHFKILRDAAASRAVSRYDLPLGPLHLMPPVALKGPSFGTVNPGEAPKGFNRCVTVWVYIDEKTGQLLDAGVERSVISQPVALSYASATGLLEGKVDTTGDKDLGKIKQLLAVVERNLNAWSQQRLQNSSAAQKREARLALKEFVASQQTQSSHKQRQRDDGQGGFRRTLGNKIVDTSLDLYSFVLAGLMRKANAFVPQQAGSEQGRGGRIATAPLRRYVDGMAQRQVLSVLCDHGGPAMTKAECKRVSQEATDAYNSISNTRSMKRSSDRLPAKGSPGQKGAVQRLKLHLAGDKGKIIPATSTGKGNEVVIKGVGAMAKVKSLKQTLKPGVEVLVRVLKIDADTGNLSVYLVEN